jgi:glycerol uptake facilitator-like aquaporin
MVLVLVLLVLAVVGIDEGLGVTSMGGLIVALVVVSISLSLGGPTGYAINPARGLGPASSTPRFRCRTRTARSGVTPGSPSRGP